MRRVSFATVAVGGLGAFVAVAAGATLYFSAVSGVRSTQALIAEQAESYLDALEQKVAAELEPVREQGEAIARAFNDGRIDLGRPAELDAFMLGALAGTPQVSGIGIVDPGGRARRWNREQGARAEDWSARRDVREWLTQGEAQASAAWRDPLWSPARHVPVLLQDVPLRRGERFVGMLGQTVPIARLSAQLAQFRDEHGVTPFILYGKDAVLAHPALAQGSRAHAGGNALVSRTEIEDPVLARLDEPAAWEPLALRGLKEAKGGHVQVGEQRYLYVQREIEGYGPRRWTLGVYLDPVRGGQRDQMLRMVASIAAGLAVLLVAVLAAGFAGRRLARTVEALAQAARAVREERLDALPRLPRSAIAEFDEAARSFEQMVAALRERRIMRDTLAAYLPEQVARALLASGGRLEPIEAKATILMCDIEGFAALTDSLGARHVLQFLNEYFQVVVGIVERHGGVITQFQGDAILAVFNLPLPDRDHAAQALRAALDIVRTCDERSFADVHARNRIGLATGRVIAGPVGSRERLSYTVHGNAVNLAARIEQINKDYGTRILLPDKTAERCRASPCARWRTQRCAATPGASRSTRPSSMRRTSTAA
jgi:class 3 adenylate cyclase